MNKENILTELEENLNKMQDALNTAFAENAKFSKGNASAGTRLRKSMQDIKNLAQNIRVKVSDVKNNNE